MVTSNKQPDKKVVKMGEQNNAEVVPQRTLLEEVNEHIMCPLCRGYYIDATTIVECLHSFCRSCIIKHLQVKSYCPVCEMMINSAKPNIKLDKALQDIVYKLVPGLFQKEMERRQQFYASRPGPAASATPEQRGEDTERIIFSPEDVISFSLEYADVTDADSISSKSSDSNEPQPLSATTRRYLQCPAVVNINHLKKFLSMKFDIDSTQFAIDILYKRVPLPDYYTLMDIAYIYNWKRNEPMRFFYQIIDYVAIRNRLFDINRKGTRLTDRKSSPTYTEDTNTTSPTPNLNDHASETSSEADSPMPDENQLKKAGDTIKKNDMLLLNKDSKDIRCPSPSKKNDDEVEKSQFLNSFELQAKSNTTLSKPSQSKSNNSDVITSPKEDNTNKILVNTSKSEENLKRKYDVTKTLPEMKKIKIEIEKTNLPITQTLTSNNETTKILNSNIQKSSDVTNMTNSIDDVKNNTTVVPSNHIATTSTVTTNEVKHQQTVSIAKPIQLDSPGQKRSVASPDILSPKKKPTESSVSQSTSLIHKTVSPLKLQIPKPDANPAILTPVDTPKSTTKKMPDLKPSTPVTPSLQSKDPTIGKLRMDLLANNCDPIIDRSKILSQVKTSLPQPNTGPTSGDPLKSLFDSCKINIPSSLSITLTDQKLEPRNSSETTSSDHKKNIVNKNLTNACTASTHKVPSPPVHNYIEILKLPDTDAKKTNKPETPTEKINPNKTDNNAFPPKQPTKTSETSAKGPIPNLKPIADTKIGKQSGNFSPPITFQQTFEQQLQSMQKDKKSKLPKNKTQVPKLVPATPKTFSAVSKLNNSNNKTSNMLLAENKVSTALDLSTPHNIQSQLGPQQTKAFEMMQSIANLAKKQNMPGKVLPMPMTQANVFSVMPNRTLPPAALPLRAATASSVTQLKLDTLNPSLQMNSPRQDSNQRNNQMKHTSTAGVTIPSSSYTSNSPSNLQPSPQSQTRSPSSSPKLIIAEDKQGSSSSEHNLNQSNQISSTQLPNTSLSKTESPKPSPGLSKPALKPVRPFIPPGKIPGLRQPIAPMRSPTNFLTPSQILSQAIFQQHFNVHASWMKNRSNCNLFNDYNNDPPTQNFNNKDKQ